ncbi:MAG: hypothetical protein WCT19_02585 [Candidatus Paceibacterota bacterium]|jgi:hypothetical protein
MFNVSFDNSLVEIGEKGPKYWTKAEEERLYWWFYNEMETPTEAQLHYCVSRYCKHNWLYLLLISFPIETNFQKVIGRFGPATNRMGRMQIKTFLRKLLNKIGQMERLDDPRILELIIQYPILSKCSRKKAREMLRKFELQKFVYEI